MKVFIALYNPMIEESAYAALSIHLSKEGAENAINADKKEHKRKWETLTTQYKNSYDYDFMQDWRITEMEILP